MEELELLQQVFSERVQWVREHGANAGEHLPRSPLKERLQDPQVVLAVDRARKAMTAVPEVREDLVASIRRQIQEGSLPLDGKRLADRILQEAVLDELT